MDRYEEHLHLKQLCTCANTTFCTWTAYLVLQLLLLLESREIPFVFVLATATQGTSIRFEFFLPTSNIFYALENAFCPLRSSSLSVANSTSINIAARWQLSCVSVFSAVHLDLQSLPLPPPLCSRNRVYLYTASVPTPNRGPQ